MPNRLTFSISRSNITTYMQSIKQSEKTCMNMPKVQMISLECWNLGMVIETWW
jgi:hypothetical protein